MTMLDDDRLAALLGRAAESFDVPFTGPDDILERAAGRGAPDTAVVALAIADDDTDEGGDEGGPDRIDGAPGPQGQGRVRRLAARAARHRVLSVAACVIVLVALAGTVAAMVHAPVKTTTSATATARHAAVPAVRGNAPATTTTTPEFVSGPGSATAKAAAPFAPSGGASAGAQSKSQSLNGDEAYGTNQPPEIQQTGSLTLTVGRGKLNRTVTQLSALAGTYGGFVASSQTQSGTPPTGSVTLQVPVQKFGAVLARAEALGQTSDLTTQATDVTSQYVDLQARITALQASRQQYLTILAKATTVGDVLAVQEQIDSIQSQIEQQQGQLQLLTSQTSYSKVAVTVRERAPESAPGPLPESGLIRAWHSGIGGFVTGVEGAIRVAGPLLFALLLLGVVLVGGRILWRRYQRHRL